MLPRLLLDTHILIRWIRDRKRLSRDQRRTLESADRTGERLAFSAITLLEIAMLVGRNKIVLKTSLNQFFADLRTDPEFQILPVTFEIAEDAAHLGILHDPRTAPSPPRHAFTG